MRDDERLTFAEVHVDGDVLGLSFKTYPESPPIDGGMKYLISANDLHEFCKTKFANAVGVA